ncbi:MAG: FHA domain-containing protein, partial [Gammaproteobacteria bacterium]|nr:FHA domain-containing protein [Gammaproteobacteria bacterium]
MLQIVFKDENGERVVHPLVPGQPITVGRGAQAELRIKNASISRAHAKIWDTGGAWFVQDLGSSNFTFVNGEKVTQSATFGDGDVVRFGDFSVKVQSDGDSGRGRAPAAADGGLSRRPRPGAVEEEPVSRR